LEARYNKAVPGHRTPKLGRCLGFARFVIVSGIPANYIFQDRVLIWSAELSKTEAFEEVLMPKKHAEDFEYLANNPNYVPDPEIEEFMEEEISRAPKDPELLAQRLRNSTAASPRDAGGDLDADWEDVNASGSETVAGDNPTPDQSIVEENAQAVGVTFEDNEELDFLDKIERRDRERFELEERSKATDDMI
jgi:hypothetical protein